MDSFKKCLGLSFIIVAIISIMVITVYFAATTIPVLWILFDIEAVFVLAFFLWFFNLIW